MSDLNLSAPLEGEAQIDLPRPRATWRGVTVCAHVAPALGAWAKAAGDDTLPRCGSYQTTTAASAGTHAGGVRRTES